MRASQARRAPVGSHLLAAISLLPPRLSGVRRERRRPAPLRSISSRISTRPRTSTRSPRPRALPAPAADEPGNGRARARRPARSELQSKRRSRDGGPRLAAHAGARRPRGARTAVARLSGCRPARQSDRRCPKGRCGRSATRPSPMATTETIEFIATAIAAVERAPSRLAAPGDRRHQPSRRRAAQPSPLASGGPRRRPRLLLPPRRVRGVRGRAPERPRPAADLGARAGPHHRDRRRAHLPRPRGSSECCTRTRSRRARTAAGWTTSSAGSATSSARASSSTRGSTRTTCT